MAENKFNFTEAAIAALPSPEKGKRACCYDSMMRGLGVSITSAGTKTFILYRWVRGKPERVTLGRFPDLSVEQARQLAADTNSKIARGINPNDEKKRHRAGKTILLEGVLADFLTARNKLSPRTIYDYQRIVNVYLQDWKDQPITCIDQEMVERRHQAIANGMKVVVKNAKGAFEEIEVKSEAQANYSMRVLRALMNFAMAQYKDSAGRPLIIDNPVKQLFQTRVGHQAGHKRDAIKSHEIKAWFNAVVNLKSDAANAKPEVIKSFLVFLLLTGMKRLEAAKLRKTQIDFKSRTLTVFDVESKQPHMLPLSDYLYVMLKQLIETTDGPYIFPGNGPKGYLIDPRKQLLKISQESGIQFTLHDLRRTFIAIAEGMDIPAYALRRLVDHRIRNDTASGDIIADVERLRKPMQMITDYMLKCAETKKSADVIAQLSGRNVDRLQEKISHIMAVRSSVETKPDAGGGRLK